MQPCPLVRLARGGRGGVPGPALSLLWLQVAWVKWMDSSAPFTMKPDTSYCSLIVPTTDTMQMSHLLGMLLANNKPVGALPRLPHPTLRPCLGRLASHVNRVELPWARPCDVL